MPRSDWLPKGLHIFVVYNSPSDFPGQYVVRRWIVGPAIVPDEKVWWLSPSLEECQLSIPEDAVRFDRDPDDDSCIVEVWF